MKLTSICKIIMIAAIIAVLLAVAGCGSYGGADVYLENISIGTITVEGKPVTGLPTQKVNIVLKTGANKVSVSQSGSKTIIKLQPSCAVITSSPDGLSFTGVAADQVEIKWTTDNTTK
ncbi:MAG: hypothetical protein NTZ34_09955 [Chloroflexi bacterium]|nr:hypothetical protein [Chloroflexota bacterium]